MAATKPYNGYIYEQQADGSWKRGAPMAPQMPADPKFPYEGPKAAADVVNTQASAGRTLVQAQGDAISNRIAAATTQAQIDAAAAKAAQAQKDAQQANSDKSAALGQFNAAVQLDQQTRTLRDKFNAGPGKTHGVMGLTDFLPTPANSAFNQAAAAARGPIFQALGLIGSQGNTGKEAEMWTGPYIPSTWDYDSNVNNSFSFLDQQRDHGFQTAIQKLGGIPDANGNIHPVGTPEAAALARHYGINPALIDTNRPTAIAATNGNSGGPGGNVPNTPWDQPSAPGMQVATGKTKQVFNPEAAAFGDALVRGGIPYEQANAAAIANGYVPLDKASYNANLAYFRDHPNSKRSFGTGYRTVPTTADNRLASSPGVAALTGITNALGAGALEAVLPDQVAGVRSAHGTAELGGEVLGSIAPTVAISKGASALASRFAPKLLGGGDLAAAMRTLAPDVAYGAVYGQNTQGDPWTGGVSALVGSATGNLIGKTAGAVVGGVTRSAPAQYLKSLNIPMTVGQQAGGIVQGLENRLSGIPVVGDLVKNRYLDSFKGVNHAAFNDAGSSIGFQPTKIGEEGVNALTDAAGNYYDNATAGAQVPVDQQFFNDLTTMQGAKANLPPDLQAKIDLAMQARVMPAVDSGTMTGEGYQQAVRGLKGYKAEATKPGFENDYRTLLTNGQQALTDLMTRNGGQDVVTGIKAGDEAYRKAMTLKKAVTAAKNGSASGENQVFSPAQLNTASWQTAAKYPGARPFAALADNAQQVLPNKVPDSGTAGRLSMLALPGLLGGGGYASDKMDLTDNATQDALTIGALLAGGGTKVGQKVLSKAIFDRPGALTATGKAIAKRAGLFGHMATVPTILLSGPNG